MSDKKGVASYLSFRLADEVFAVHVAKVMEIIEVSRITKIPQTPDFMRGITNLRGNVLPIIDSRLKFGMEQVEDTVDTCIIVLSITIDEDEVTVGALVDSVVEVVDIAEKQIKAKPKIGKKYASQYINGIAQVDEDFIILLDVDQVFSSEEITLIKERVDETEITNQEEAAAEAEAMEQ